MLHNEQALLQRLSRGDEAAFSALYLHYKDRIYTVAYRLTRSAPLSEEIVQDIFLKVWIKREQLEKVHSFRDFLFIITRNHIFTVLKRLALHQHAVSDLTSRQPQAEGGVDGWVLNREYQHILQQAINRLPPQQKLVYQLSREQGLKREEIAAQLQLSADTVKHHLSRAMRAIRIYCLSSMKVYLTLALLSALPA